MREQNKSASGRLETCSISNVRRVAAMLDLPSEGLVEGAALPRGWHFTLLGADTLRSHLRGDGFPGLGIPLPELGLPRLLQAGRNVTFHGDIPIGANITRNSSIASLERKSTRSGEIAIVVVDHRLVVVGESKPAINETQTFFLLPATAERPSYEAEPELVTLSRQKSITPDDTLLFQYSALGFNSHKIHLDRAYAREVEGFPDLVVNGGLTTLLLTEYLRTELKITPRQLKIKYTAPLFSSRSLTIADDSQGDVLNIKVFNNYGKVAAEMEVEAYEY
ncbi:MaoC family dehydratase N-terminal domain-containing protein [Pseudomonas sp. YuFO20]|uniref:FAS1-like dehydratase domain-containing protein n=1 Tax=Pseudomonas sp. YuFO20 TaxID=3095362 RepID=UPI002B249F63|nr:MaoC family dehydratase N-terminal domain-containing protein [Pseudomonas sp. YuFO20]MEB2514107.1 MaoC family dehydratase N-terminal domain-containing protein [Pseudomonas sp. YuFO20]